jgi:transposase
MDTSGKLKFQKECTMSNRKDPEAIVREIKRKTRRKYSSEEKIRIVLEGLRGEQTIAELCRREGISPNLYYNWSKEFLEAGKRRLMGDTKREATSGEVIDLRRENLQLKEMLAELALRVRVLKKNEVGPNDNPDLL